MTVTSSDRLSKRPGLAQLCPFTPELERALVERFQVFRLFDLDDVGACLAEYGSGIEAIATGGHVGAPNDLVERLPSLGIIAVNGVGYDKVDLERMRARNVRVTTTPGVLTNDVADLAVGLTIGLFRRIVAADAFVRHGKWVGGEPGLGRTASGRTFGIVGLGRIGTAVADRLRAFGDVAYTGRSAKAVTYRFVPDVVELARLADILIVTALADSSTKMLIDRRVLDALGPKGFLVNVSRGSLVDEQALIDALDSGAIAGAALDVFEHEPHVPDELLCNPNVIVTPHIGSATVETRQQMGNLMLENLDAFFAGAPLPTALV